MHLNINNIYLPPTLIYLVQKYWDRIAFQGFTTLSGDTIGSNYPTVNAMVWQWVPCGAISFKKGSQKGLILAYIKKNKSQWIYSFSCDMGRILMIKKLSLIPPLQSPFCSSYAPAFPSASPWPSAYGELTRVALPLVISLPLAHLHRRGMTQP